MTLELHSPSPSDFGGEKTRSLTRTASKGVSAMASYTPVFFDLASTLTSPTPTLEHLEFNICFRGGTINL